ncbi:hypothetical protein M271_44125 [Streptomyces rapamycinicus NRRL 5491]|nr:hypothetical protein M271_44125 [Streptomyces rapamycinicus NRRL 5491]
MHCGDAVRSGSLAVLVHQATESGPSIDSMGLEVGDVVQGGWFDTVTVRGQLLPGLWGRCRMYLVSTFTACASSSKIARGISRPRRNL